MRLFLFFRSGIFEACVFLGCCRTTLGDWFQNHPLTRCHIPKNPRFRMANVHRIQVLRWQNQGRRDGRDIQHACERL